MIAIAPQSTATTKIFLDGVTWPTFKALMAGVKEDRDYRITYNADQLLLERIQPDNTSDAGYLVLNGVSWSTYKLLMADVGDGRAWRIAYASGVLELRMPLEEHEEPKRILEDFVTAMVDELGIELRSLGALTLEREELGRGIEPDSCFYIQNELRVRGQNICLPEDPPPDLAIESDLVVDLLALQDSLCWFSGLNEFSRLSALAHSTKMFTMNICIRNSIEPFFFE
jgi:Putative restriction endonuclease